MGYCAKALAVKSHGGTNLYLQISYNNIALLCLKGEATIFETKEEAEKATEQYTLYNWIIEKK